MQPQIESYLIYGIANGFDGNQDFAVRDSLVLLWDVGLII